MEDISKNFDSIDVSCADKFIKEHLSYSNMVDKVDVDMMETLKLLANFVKPARTFLNCHFSDYFLKSFWDTMVPVNLRKDLEDKSIGQVKQCMIDLVSGEWKNYKDARLDVYNKNWNFTNVVSLEQLVVAVGKLKLSELNLCTSYDIMKENRNRLKTKFPNLFVDLEFDRFMTSKKMHEVMKFSEFIACTCTGVNFTESNFDFEPPHGAVQRIVDVGSGKGYLSSFLALYYDLKVLAIDASVSNTEGCDKRTAKLDKAWPQLVRRAKERQRNGSCVTVGRHWRKKLEKLGISEEEYLKSLELQTQSAEKNLKSVTELITTKTDLQHLVDTNLVDELNEQSSQYGIIGLHTCGNLGANILKLFLHNSKAQFICVVPCCYNLVKEDESLYPETIFYGSKLNEDSCHSTAPWPDGSIGFPLSSILKNYECEKPFALGRNTRMLSAYSLPRMMQESTLEMSAVIGYRSLLQVLLMEHGLLSPSGAFKDTDVCVGRMTKKCGSFSEYVSFALQRLKIDQNVLSSESIKSVENNYTASMQTFHKYYLLRALFASVVEDLILLDRMVYLLEQESILEARLVQLFDPALSPRSHAIIAMKKINK